MLCCCRAWPIFRSCSLEPVIGQSILHINVQFAALCQNRVRNGRLDDDEITTMTTTGNTNSLLINALTAVFVAVVSNWATFKYYHESGLGMLCWNYVRNPAKFSDSECCNQLWNHSNWVNIAKGIVSYTPHLYSVTTENNQGKCKVQPGRPLPTPSHTHKWRVMFSKDLHASRFCACMYRLLPRLQ